MTNTQWVSIPFTAKGINFVSRVDTTHPIYSRIKSLPAGVFEEMNIQAVSEILTVEKTFTLSEIQKELDRVNEGGSYAFIELGENN
jgi:hypothetical protein